MFNFIDYYREYYKERESPDIFWYWSAISCISAVLRDNVYLRIHDEYIYPNMYIILLADSGERKDAPCKAAAKLIQDVGNTKFIGGRNSIQAVVKELGQTFTTDNGKVLEGAAGIMFSEELDSFIVNDPATVGILIQLYDYHEKWDSSLVGGARYTLKDVCVSMFAASNSKLFANLYNDSATEGGLLGRTFIVKPTNKRPRKSLFDFSPQALDRTPLVEHLQFLAKMRGAIKYTYDAQVKYNQWYYGIPEEIFSDRIGFGSRLGTHVFKVSVAIAAARENFRLEIEEKDVDIAIELCTKLRTNYKQIAIGLGLSSRSKQVSVLLQYFLRQRGYATTRPKMMQAMMGDIEGEVLDSLLLYLEGAEFIVPLEVKRGTMGYKLTQRAVEILLGEKDD